MTSTTVGGSMNQRSLSQSSLLSEPEYDENDVENQQQDTSSSIPKPGLWRYSKTRQFTFW